MPDGEHAWVLGSGLVMTFRVIGPWRKGEGWFAGGKPQPPNPILLPLCSWEDRRSSILSTTLPLQLWRISSNVPLLWWGKSLPSSSIGGCLRDRALISFDSLGYLYSWDLSWRLSRRYLLLVLRMLSTVCSGDFLVPGELWWRSFSACSCGSAFTWRSGERAILLGLVFSSSSSSETELHLFRDSENDSDQKKNVVNSKHAAKSRLFQYRSVVNDVEKAWQKSWTRVYRETIPARFSRVRTPRCRSVGHAAFSKERKSSNRTWM